jgi:BRCA1-associated protein
MSSELQAAAREAAPKSLAFTSGNHYVEVTKGILHLFKENKSTPLGEEAERSELVCMISVPTSMTTHDLMQFVAPFEQDIESIRIIRDSKPNQYMVLIRFRNQKSADEFYRNFNGVAFNSIEPETCHLVYVERVETLNETDRRVTQPIPGHTELPTCPVCLEKMDESVQGVLTILCNHSFHGKCLDKWGDTSCPVCRYSSTPETQPQNSCFECAASDAEAKTDESLWICLICGHIGCGRYVEGHAYKHYCETQHTYAMQLGNNRVWDYAGDNYVHRLLQNKSDGKMVEVEANPDQRASDEKIDAVQLEYTYLLTNQLENQRRYFEDTMHKMDSESQEKIKSLIEKTNNLTIERDNLSRQVATLTKEKNAIDKKLNLMSSKFAKTLHDVQEEKQLNQCLRENQQLWQNKLQEVEQKLTLVEQTKDKEVAELKDQVRDLMFFLETQSKLKEVPDEMREEIESGTMIVGQAASSSSTSSSGKSRTNKKK